MGQKTYEQNGELFITLYDLINSIVYSLEGESVYRFTEYIVDILGNFRKATTQLLVFKLENLGHNGKQFSISSETVIFIKDVLKLIKQSVKNKDEDTIKKTIIGLKPQAEIIIRFLKENDIINKDRNVHYLYNDVKRIINIIFNINKGLADKLARKMKPSHVAFEDILQKAYLGLQIAIVKYYPCQIEFSTYSHNWIKQAIIEETITSNLLSMDAKAIKQYRDIKEKINDIRQQQLEENLHILSSLTEEERKLVYSMFPLSAEIPVYSNSAQDNEELTLMDTLSSPDNCFMCVENQLIIEKILALLKSTNLTDEEIFALFIEGDLNDYLPQNTKILRLHDKKIRRVYFESAKDKILNNPELRSNFYTFLRQCVESIV